MNSKNLCFLSVISGFFQFSSISKFSFTRFENIIYALNKIFKKEFEIFLMRFELISSSALSNFLNDLFSSVHRKT